MNLSANAMPNQDYHSFREYLKSLNAEYVEEKSKIYSYDFIKDSPLNSIDINQTKENSNSPSKAFFEVNYEWHRIVPNLIGKKKRKDSDSSVKKRLQHALKNIKPKESVDVRKDSEIPLKF